MIKNIGRESEKTYYRNQRQTLRRPVWIATSAARAKIDFWRGWRKTKNLDATWLMVLQSVMVHMLIFRISVILKLCEVVN